jgi:hypothetical protein
MPNNLTDLKEKRFNYSDRVIVKNQSTGESKVGTIIDVYEKGEEEDGSFYDVFYIDSGQIGRHVDGSCIVSYVQTVTEEANISKASEGEQQQQQQIEDNSSDGHGNHIDDNMTQDKDTVVPSAEDNKEQKVDYENASQSYDNANANANDNDNYNSSADYDYNSDDYDDDDNDNDDSNSNDDDDSDYYDKDIDYNDSENWTNSSNSGGSDSYSESEFYSSGAVGDCNSDESADN